MVGIATPSLEARALGPMGFRPDIERIPVFGLGCRVIFARAIPRSLMRNLGGAIGIALIDTVLFARTPDHAARITALLQAGDRETALALGLPAQALLLGDTTATRDMIRPLIEKLALVRAFNEAWGLVALLTACAALSLLALLRTAPLIAASRVAAPNAERKSPV